MLPLLGLELLIGLPQPSSKACFISSIFSSATTYAISPFSKSRRGANGLEMAPDCISGSQDHGQTDLLSWPCLSLGLAVNISGLKKPVAGNLYAEGFQVRTWELQLCFGKPLRIGRMSF